MTDRALVLCGGGLAGIAWETGLLVGIRDGWPGFVDILADPDTRFVGTSAGSAVASQVAAGVDLDALYAVQLAPESAELGAEMDAMAYMEMMGGIQAQATSPIDFRQRVGAMAMAQDTGVSPASRRDAIATRLIAAEWPDRDLQIAAVDAESGELRVFEPDSGVPLLDAVGASCAVPGIWPVVEIEGHKYMDGGARSIGNIDLAAGADRVIIAAPLPADGIGTLPQDELDALGDAAVKILNVDDDSLAAFGTNPLDPSTRPASAEAGRAQGRVLAESIREFWG